MSHLGGLGAAIGVVAAALTSLSYLPQVRKALPPRSTADLSLKMLVFVTLGLALWVIYGAIKGDLVIVVANSVGAALTGIVLACKLRDLRALRRQLMEQRAGHPVGKHPVPAGTLTSEDRP